MKTTKSYKEINLDKIGFDRTYRNPLTNVFQYEYALYSVVSALFARVMCRSMCVDSLNLYFRELPHMKVTDNESEMAFASPDSTSKRKTQEGLLQEMTFLVERDVIGNICFPMMNVCAAEVSTSVEGDGSHRFIFSDGIYGFSIHIDMGKKGHPKRLDVKNIGYRPNVPKYVHSNHGGKSNAA